MTASPAMQSFEAQCEIEAVAAVERTIAFDTSRLVEVPGLFERKADAMFPLLRARIGRPLTNAEVISACQRMIDRELKRAPRDRDPSTFLAARAMMRAAEIRSKFPSETPSSLGR